MTTNVKYMIKQINDGKNLEEHLPQYANQYLTLNYRRAMLHLAMNYFTLYQVVSERENPYVKEVTDTIDFINYTIKEVLAEDFNMEVSQVLVSELDGVRDSIIKKMQVLTAYTDKLQIYEYVLNRIEDKFTEKKNSIDDVAFVQKLVQYIFGTKDNVIINENIKQVLGQLPVRMTKARYFELIKNSLSIYKGADKSTVDTYLYMLRTSAMLYHGEGEGEYFREIQGFVDKLTTIDYGQLDKEEYDKISAQLQQNAEKINGIVDLYVSFQEVLNQLYIVLLGEPYITETQNWVTGTCKEILSSIEELFAKGEDEAIPTQVEKQLCTLEGQPETLHELMVYYEQVLSEVRIHYSSIVESLMLDTLYQRLYLMEKLSSTSIFIELQTDTSEDQKADVSYINQVTEELIGDLKELFDKNPQCVNRSVMASTLNKLPVFFNSSDEVVEYIKFSIEQCHDQAEKQACVQLLNEMIEDSNRWK